MKIEYKRNYKKRTLQVFQDGKHVSTIDVPKSSTFKNAIKEVQEYYLKFANDFEAEYNRRASEENKKYLDGLKEKYKAFPKHQILGACYRYLRNNQMDGEASGTIRIFYPNDEKDFVAALTILHDMPKFEARVGIEWDKSELSEAVKEMKKSSDVGIFELELAELLGVEASELEVEFQEVLYYPDFLEAFINRRH